MAGLGVNGLIIIIIIIIIIIVIIIKFLIIKINLVPLFAVLWIFITATEYDAGTYRTS